MIKLQFDLNKKSMIVWISILTIMILGFMAFYPTMADESIQVLLEGMSDSMLQVLGFHSFPDFSKIEIFYGYIIQYVNMGLVVYALSLGLNTYLKEEKEGTIEFLYGQPITRTNLILSKLIGNLIIIGIILFSIISISILSLYIFTPADANFSTILYDSIPVFLVIICNMIMFLLLGTGLSLILPSTTSVIGVSMAIVFIPYVIGMMAQMIDKISSLEFISILHTTMPDRIYSQTNDIYSLLMWVTISVIALIYGLIKFKKKDMYF